MTEGLNIRQAPSVGADEAGKVKSGSSTSRDTDSRLFEATIDPPSPWELRKNSESSEAENRAKSSNQPTELSEEKVQQILGDLFSDKAEAGKHRQDKGVASDSSARESTVKESRTSESAERDTTARAATAKDSSEAGSSQNVAEQGQAETKPAASEQAGAKSQVLTTEQIEQKLGEGGGLLGHISPSASWALADTFVSRVPLFRSLAPAPADTEELVSSIAYAAMNNAEQEKALSDKLAAEADSSPFLAGVSGVVGSLGIGWLANKAAYSAPAAVKLPLIAISSLAGGGMVNNYVSGDSLGDSSGFVKNTINTGVALAAVKTIGAFGANKAISSETMIAAGMDSSKNVVGSQFANELTLTMHNLNVQSWKAMDKNAAGMAAHLKGLVVGVFGGPFGAMGANSMVKAEMEFIRHGPQLASTGERFAEALVSRLNPVSYTPFRVGKGGFQFAGLGGERSAQMMAQGLEQRSGQWASTVMSRSEYNTRAFASKLTTVTGGAYAFGAANKAGEILTTDAISNKSFSENLMAINKEALGTAVFAPVAVVATPGLSGAVINTGLAASARGMQMLDKQGQSMVYEKIKQDKLDSEAADRKIFDWHEHLKKP